MNPVPTGGGPFPPASEEAGGAVSVRGDPFPVWLPEGRFPSAVFAEPLLVAEVVPKNCYYHTSRLSTVIGTSATSRSPPCTTLPEGCVADSSPRLQIILWAGELSISEDFDSSLAPH